MTLASLRLALDPRNRAPKPGVGLAHPRACSLDKHLGLPMAYTFEVDPQALIRERTEH